MTIKSQQCTQCAKMFESSEGKHNSHDKKTNSTPKKTEQQWVCDGCRANQGTT